ncbi:MAG: DAK2 domain-containing protein [Christensenellaceae bacterium]|nr:DAK2 domain-containing protein [Christensenellaceae bacterium]MDD6927338.1 DAK2 domain-containing protein [bacterium]MDY2850706.1 DAK2 domain-containing protein [Christensenellaceae bacterium]
MLKTINGAMFVNMMHSAAKNLEINRSKIDALNVFPVPDGDTGTNMSLTFQSAIKELGQCVNNNLGDLSSAVSKGALKGARGNSGVILSQILKGLCSVCKNVAEIDTRTFAKALKSATDTAYKAVSKPKEGTILTVCRAISDSAAKCRKREFEEFFEDFLAAGQESLDKTPELLPVLKKAGVVDAGGMGLLTVYRGMLKAINGEKVEAISVEVPVTAVKNDEIPAEHAELFQLGRIEFAYCTEFFVINLKKKTTLADIDKLKEYLMGIGDSVICIGDLEFIKVHVHTNNPGQALSKALQLGELDKVKIENMLEQNRALLKKYEAEKKEMGMLAICSGDGLSAIFKDLQVDRVIEGGQTMNPSASDIADAVMKVNADNVFVFPNNKNIILAAEQAKELVKNKKMYVIPTKSVPQGFSAALAFDPEAKPDENLVNMLHSLDNVTVGQVTYAVRTTKIDRFSLKEGDIIGLDNKKILAKGKEIEDVAVKLVDTIKDKSHEMINLYYGSDISEEDAERLKCRLQEIYPDCEIESYYGGQPIYYYIISLE